ncbi:MAG: MCE family protein [Ignavibacteriaceae bacterium]|nr:MCE family protein [Ignavibacteriaceae bacterium]HRP93711.1 MlaD family protein [Ignavibacteriaceae bacterium]HRQ54311.1 MlaD family protein [Ignavibacteriaceae bacterium]
MKNERKTEIRVGLTVLVGILVFIWILGWAKNFSLQSNEQLVKVRFTNVSGLEIGDQVTVNGMRKGYVKEMIVEPNNVVVKLSIDNDIKLKEDASFAISMLDLMGGKKVEVFPGSSSTNFNINKISSGTFYADIPSVMSLFGSVQDDLVTILKDVKVSLHSLNKYITDEKMSSDVKTSLSNLSLLTDKLNIMLSENRNDIKSLTKNAVELTETSNQLLSSNKENIDQLFADLKNVFQKSDTLLTDLNNLTKETMNQQNNVGKLLYDEEVIKDLKQTLKQVNDLTSILIEQLKNDGINVDANIF